MASSHIGANTQASSSSSRTGHTESFKHPSLPNPRTQDVFQSIVKGRKSWKTLRGGEVVWPPELEAALIEGLEHYQPDDSRETRLLGRFPMRNRFISDWIYRKTGKRRTAKQVGSRLQQLRDTCGGKRLLNLLSPTRRPPRRAPSTSPELQANDVQSYGPPPLRFDSESCSDSSGSLPSTPTEPHATLQSLLYRGVEPRVEELPNNIIYIDLLAEDAPAELSLKSPSDQAAEERSWSERGFTLVRASAEPRHLRDIDSTVTLLSRVPISATSHFTVHADEGMVFSESVPLEPVDPSSVPTLDGTLLYKTTLVPDFWDTIVQCPDASRYVIIQRVMEEPSTSLASPIFSAMYRFNYAHSIPQAPTYTAPTIMADETVGLNLSSLIPMPVDPSFNTDMIYPPAKTPNYFDFGYVPTHEDWSSASDSTGSVYASPIDPHKSIPFSMSADDHLLSSSAAFSTTDVGNFVL